MLQRAGAKLLMRTAGDQTKIVCGSLQLCTGIESGIEGATFFMVQRWRERTNPAHGERSYDASYGGQMVEKANDGRGNNAALVGSVLYVPEMLVEENALGERGGGG